MIGKRGMKSQRHTNRKESTGLFYLLPSLLGISLFYILPFFKSLGYTFTQGIVQLKFVWFDNFTDLFRSEVFLLALKNTASFILAGVPLLLLLSLIISLRLGEAAHTWMRFALLAPLVIPGAAFMLGFQAIFGENGIFRGLDLFGAGAFPLLVVLYLIKNIGYITIIFTGAISALPKEYKEVFLLEASSELVYIRKVLLPLIAPMTFFAFVISVMNCFKIYREIYVLYGDIPPKSIYMLQHFMNNNFYKLNYQRLCTAAFLMILGISVFILFYLKRQEHVRKEM